MAIYTTITCLRCGLDSDEIHSAGDPHPSICSHCRSKEAAENLGRYLKTRSKLSIKQRLRMIETQLWAIANRPESFDWNQRIG